MNNLRKPDTGVDCIHKIVVIGDCPETSNLARQVLKLGFETTDCGQENGSLPDRTVIASLAIADAIVIATDCPQKYDELIYKRGSALVAARSNALFIDFSDVPDANLSAAKSRITRLGKRYMRGSMIQADAIFASLESKNRALPMT